ncbi:hypothetical protein HDU84_005931 [Entophlyctis sp. JEL0112]|nr:hypothetical protein HDU84_005931 [Entophlyctis sp. JEL0112]
MLLPLVPYLIRFLSRDVPDDKLEAVIGGRSVAKGGLGEIHLDDNGRSWAYSLSGSLYAFSGVVGPLIGGILVRPDTGNAESADISSKYPFLPACLVGTLLSIIAIPVTWIFFKEPKVPSQRSTAVSMDGLDRGRSTDESLKDQLSELFSAKGMRKLYFSLREPMTAKAIFPITLYVSY